MNAAMERISASDRLMLEALQHDTFGYFIRNANSTNGLIADKTDRDSAASTAAVGLALSSYCVAVERGWLTRADAAKSTVTTLRFFDSCERGPTADATGYHGFFYHFLDMSTGRRALQSELSTIDTALLIAGVLTCGWYFSRANDVEAEIRELSDRLYRQVDWQWMCNDGATLGHGWKPECGFLVSAWNQGYSEALLLYILALGSPTYAIEPRGYREWTETFEVKIAYGKSYIYAGPLFIHQLPQVWLDFRGIRDHCDRKFDVDYFENSQRAVHVQRLYAAHNPHGFAHYSKNAWGITASDGPGPTERVIDGVRREFFGYRARRRHNFAVGSDHVVAVCASPRLRINPPCYRSLRTQGQTRPRFRGELQCNLSGTHRQSPWLDFPVAIRTQRRADRVDAGELFHWNDMERVPQ